MRTIQVVAYTVLYTTSIPGMFLGVKILNQTSAALGCLEFYCSGSSSHNITTFQVFEEGLSPPTSIQVIQLKILHEFSETYEPYWTTGDFSADLLQALTPGKLEISRTVVRNALRTVIAMVLQPTYLAIESRALLEGNKLRLKRCNPTRKVVLQYWTTGDFSADLQALTPVKFDLSISVIRNALRTVIATVLLQPTYLAIDSMTLLGGNKSRLKRCNPTRKVVFTTIFFSVSFQGCKQCKH